ncbi:MAG: hypothetical protein ACI8V5_004379, partial [Limisphaerales bacterium]
EIVERLLSSLKFDILRGRSTKGSPAKNDVSDIVLWKSEQKKTGGGANSKKTENKKSRNKKKTGKSNL